MITFSESEVRDLNQAEVRASKFSEQEGRSIVLCYECVSAGENREVWEIVSWNGGDGMKVRRLKGV